MLSLRTKHALRALMALATVSDDGTLNTSDLVEATGASRGYLENILTELTRHGLIRSVRGRGGGFRLARPAEMITYAEVIRALEGPLALAPCASLTRYARCADCTDEHTCAIRKALISVRNATAEVLEHTTIAPAT
jgi:Rrf2 family protein